MTKKEHIGPVFMTVGEKCTCVDKKEKAPERGRMFDWLGYLDSNQGITVSETAVLPLDYTPINSKEKYKIATVNCQEITWRKFVRNSS